MAEGNWYVLYPVEDSLRLPLFSAYAYALLFLLASRFWKPESGEPINQMSKLFISASRWRHVEFDEIREAA